MKQTRTPRKGSDALRQRIIEAAIEEFSEHGFDGASTRAIASRAKVHQPQIIYHFKSKTGLWQAVVEQLMVALSDHSAKYVTNEDPLDIMKAIIRGVVTFVGRNPALQRIVIQEGTVASDRLEWLVEEHLKSRYLAMAHVWQTLVSKGVAARIEPEMFNYFFLGLASTVHTSAPEARLLTGIEPSDEAFLEKQIAAITALLLPGAAHA